MRILVTGASGFLGRPLCQMLAGRGHAVTGASRATGLDVTDGARVHAFVAGVRPEVIYHLAGPAFIPDSKRDTRRCSRFWISLAGRSQVSTICRWASCRALKV